MPTNNRTQMMVRKHLQLPFVGEIYGSGTVTAEKRRSWVEQTIAASKKLMDLAETEKRDFSDDEKLAFDEGLRLVDYWKQNPSRSLGGRQVPPEQIPGVPSEARDGREPAPRFMDQNGHEVRGLRIDESIKEVMPYELPDGIRADELSLGRLVKAKVTGNWRDAQAELRALGGSSDVLGGTLVPFPLAGDVIDLARNQTVVLQAGATTVPMTSSTLAIARLNSDPGIGWKVENQPANFSDATFGLVRLSARTLMALCSASVELVEDASNLDTVLKNALAKVLALELDRAALRGDGSAAAPLGVKNVQLGLPGGVQLIDLGTNGAQFTTTTTFTQFSQAMQLILTKNGIPRTAIFAPRTWGTIDKFQNTVQDALEQPESFKSLQKLITNQIPITNTKGSSNVSSEAYVGDFNQMLLGMRTELNIEVTRVGGDSSGSAFRNLSVWLRAYLRADVVLARPEHFCVIDGIIP